MRKHYEERLEDLNRKMLNMASRVEEAVDRSVKALQERDMSKARQVVNDDEKIDEMEREIEEECIKLTALQQPVAGDLRIISAISKIATDLERIGDHAVNIAEMVLEIGEQKLIKPLEDIPLMAETAITRLHESLEAFTGMDAAMAEELARQDEKIDRCDERILKELITMMMKDCSNLEQAVRLIFISRFLERIGDHTTNICEKLIYAATGERTDY